MGRSPVGKGYFAASPNRCSLPPAPCSCNRRCPAETARSCSWWVVTFRGELTSFDLKTGKPSLFLGGISADWMEASHDGSQIVYVSYPQGDLWKSNTDGTGRVQLTFGAIRPVLPRWSPDGRQILFFDFPTGPGHPGKMYAISSAGGAPRQLLASDTRNEQDPTWSADGKQIAFGCDPNDANAINGPAIRILNVQSGEVLGCSGFGEDVLASLVSGWTLPGGNDQRLGSSDAVRLSDAEWKVIGNGTMSWMNWSSDSQYIYFKDATGQGAVERVHIRDGKVEKLLDLKDFVFAGLGGGSVSVGPDGSVLLLRRSRNTGCLRAGLDRAVSGNDSPSKGRGCSETKPSSSLPNQRLSPCSHLSQPQSGLCF